MYCCPLAQWWERKRAALLATLDGGPEEVVTVHRLAWDERNRVLGKLEVSLPRRELRARIETALGGPIADAHAIPEEAAAKLMAALMDLNRTSIP